MQEHISSSDFKFLEAARCESFRSPVSMKHGCVAVVNGRIMATGHNNYRTSSKDGFICNSCTCHAEMDALRNMNKRTGKRGKNLQHSMNDTSLVSLFKKTTLYIARAGNNGEFRDSGPCAACLSIIKTLNLKKIVYSCSENTLVVCKPSEYTPVHHTFGRKHIEKISNVSHRPYLTVPR
jgi:tRNA(Arg) A34 adenosine deaminase TadA